MKRASFISVFLISLFLFSIPLLVSGRTFKTLQGVPIEASFVEVKGAGTKRIVVLKLDRTGKNYDIPFARLSLTDKQFVDSVDAEPGSGKPSSIVNAGAPLASGKSSLPPQSGPAVFSNLSSKLVAVNGGSVKNFKLKAVPEYYAFYFAANWCPPCNHFTPLLAKYYENNISFANPRFEIIYVSRDNSKNEMENYMRKSGMPWPAIRYTDSTREKLIKKYAPSVTPSLVLVDRAGKVISESYVDGKPRGAFAVKQDIAFWFTGGERYEDGIIKSGLTNDKRVSD